MLGYTIERDIHSKTVWIYQLRETISKDIPVKGNDKQLYIHYETPVLKIQTHDVMAE